MYRRYSGNDGVAGSAFSEMLWDKTMLGYWNDTVISSKKKYWCGRRDLNLEPPEKVASMPTVQALRFMCLHRFTILFLRHFMTPFQLRMLHSVVWWENSYG